LLIFNADGGPDVSHGSGIAARCPAGWRLKMHSKMTVNRGTSSVAALVMARVAQRRAQENQDPEMLADATEYENRALAAIKLGQSELFHWRTQNRQRFSCDYLAFDGSDRSMIDLIHHGKNPERREG
jgi:hypothetical protein